MYMFVSKPSHSWAFREIEPPAVGIVVFRDPTFWQLSEWRLLAPVLGVLGLAAFIGYLLDKQKQLNAARKEQMRLSGMLINAHEDERRRLASELHDDFSQRLAVLSLGLETAIEMIPESRQRVAQQLQELLQSADELGADLHTLSHRLHSSTLERLGLVPGVSAFCKEFAVQQGIPVIFKHENVASTLSSEMSLCLFRIIQEGLRNIKKHSGAANARVTLEKVDRFLHLSVADDGVGFDVTNHGSKEGLGIRSMEERARLIGARFEIRSKPQKGTRIDVWMQPAPQKCERAVNNTAVPSTASVG